MGADVWAGDRQALTAASEVDEQQLPGRRNIYKGDGQGPVYLYRAVDSTGQTIDFLLTATRDADGAKRFFRKVFAAQENPTPRVNPVYPATIDALKPKAGCRAGFACASASI